MNIKAKDIKEVGYDLRHQEVILFFYKAVVVNNVNKKEYRFQADYKTFVKYAEKILKTNKS